MFFFPFLFWNMHHSLFLTLCFQHKCLRGLHSFITKWRLHEVTKWSNTILKITSISDQGAKKNPKNQTVAAPLQLAGKLCCDIWYKTSSLFQWKFQQFHNYFMENKIKQKQKQQKSSFGFTVLNNTHMIHLKAFHIAHCPEQTFLPASDLFEILCHKPTYLVTMTQGGKSNVSLRTTTFQHS